MVLNMAVRCPASDRITLLYNVAKSIDGGDIYHQDESSVVSLKSVETIIERLLDTWQIPNEKRVIETDVNFPFKVYRTKGANDMITEYLNHSKLPLDQTSTLTFEQFRDLMLGEYVCAWAECKRSSNK